MDWYLIAAISFFLGNFCGVASENSHGGVEAIGLSFLILILALVFKLGTMM